MKKRALLLIVLVLLVAGGVFAESNRIWFDYFPVLGLGTGYERMLNGYWSIGVTAFLSDMNIGGGTTTDYTGILESVAGFMGITRLYYSGFFGEVGIGYGDTRSVGGYMINADSEIESNVGFMLSPCIGYGLLDGAMPLSARLPIVFGDKVSVAFLLSIGFRFEF
jgi:hypothetical protein